MLLRGSVFLVLVLVLSVACQPERRPAPSSISAVPTTPPAPDTPSPRPAATGAPSAAGRPPTGVPAASPAACGYAPAVRLAELQDRAIREASALAASRRTPGAYWTINDSGNDPVLFAFDAAGRRLGTFRLDGVENEDWESLQVGPGRDGAPALYLGDTGDNRQVRRELVIYRTPEPPLGQATDKPATSRLGGVETFRFSLPGGARDVETLLVHPTSGEVLLVSKELSGRGQVFRYPPPLDAGRRAELELVGTVDLRQLGPFGGLVTDGAVSPDGRRVALRTYLAVLEFDVPSGAPLSAIWDQQPRTYRLDDGPQGEGLTYRPDGKALLTIGENTPAILHQLEWHC